MVNQVETETKNKRAPDIERMELQENMHSLNKDSHPSFCGWCSSYHFDFSYRSWMFLGYINMNINLPEYECVWVFATMGFLTKIYLRVDTPIQWMVFSWFLIPEWWMLLFKSSVTWRVLSFGVCSFQFVGKKKSSVYITVWKNTWPFEKKHLAQLTLNSLRIFPLLQASKKLSPKTQPAQQEKKRQAPLDITHLEVARFPRPAKDSFKTIRWDRDSSPVKRTWWFNFLGNIHVIYRDPPKMEKLKGSGSGPKLRKHLNIFEHQPRNAPDPPFRGK